MRRVSVSEAKRQLDALIDAARHEPVMIQKQRRDVAVLLSVEAYERITAFNRKAFLDFCEPAGKEAEERGLNEEILNQILAEDT